MSIIFALNYLGRKRLLLQLQVLWVCLIMSGFVFATVNDTCNQLLDDRTLQHKPQPAGFQNHYYSSPKSWSQYLQQTKENSTPRESLVVALQYLQTNHMQPGLAVDIGAGTGRDTLYLLAKGWQVLAIDFAVKAIDIIKSRAKLMGLPSPETQVHDFQHMKLPEQIDLINAYLAIPFVKPEYFKAVWNNIIDHLRPGGLFAGSLLGEHDDFAANPAITVLSDKQLKCLFWPYEILYLKKVQQDLPDKATGQLRHWEIWEFVIRKP